MKKILLMFSYMAAIAFGAMFTVSCSEDDDENLLETYGEAAQQVEELMPELWCDMTFAKDSLLILMNLSEDKNFRMVFILYAEGQLQYQMLEGKWKPFLEKNKNEIRGGGLWELGNEKTGIVEGKVYLLQNGMADISKMSTTVDDINVYYEYDKILEAISVVPQSQTRYSWSEFWDDVKKTVSAAAHVVVANPVTKTVVDWTQTALSTMYQLGTFSDLVRGTAQGYDNWMEDLPDNTKICDLSIPGTHDTFTYDAKFSALYTATQGMTILGQWGAGVRMFDFRVNANNFNMAHGPVDFCSLADALNRVNSQLRAHDSETAVIMLKIENGDETDLAKKEINDRIKKEFGDKIAKWKPDMTLGEARGKIIVMYRYQLDEKDALGPSLTGYGDNKRDQRLRLGSVETPLYVQDAYEPHSLEFDSDYWERKQRLMTANFVYAADSKESNDNSWVINHTSGYTGTYASMNYFRNASVMNPFADKYIRDHFGKKTGIIMMDFAGVDAFGDGDYSCGDKLPVTIIENNFKMFGRK